MTALPPSWNMSAFFFPSAWVESKTVPSVKYPVYSIATMSPLTGGVDLSFGETSTAYLIPLAVSRICGAAAALAGSEPVEGRIESDTGPATAAAADDAARCRKARRDGSDVPRLYALDVLVTTMAMRNPSRNDELVLIPVRRIVKMNGLSSDSRQVNKGSFASLNETTKTLT